MGGAERRLDGPRAKNGWPSPYQIIRSEYGDFEGTLISEGTYGAGEVRIWDNGNYETDVDPRVSI